MRVAVVNAGSSSVKLRVLDAGDTVAAEREVERWDGDPAALRDFARAAGAVDAVGHRVVHGGTQFSDPVRVDDAVADSLRALTTLAPLHQPRSLATLDAARAVWPEVPHVACFDTAFHATIPPAAHTYALPQEWRDRWPLRRFGFHGLSHAYAARRAAELLGRPPDALRVVTCHLGAGSSLAAVRGGRSVDTTMGFTPLEGLVMGTRSGSVDPGIVLWLCTDAGLDPETVADGLERRSGLLGLAGSADMREVVAARGRGDGRAVLAFDVFVHRLRREIGAMVAALAGLDALVFTGGIGEHSPEVRAAAVDGLAFLGAYVDAHDNGEAAGDTDISAADATVRTFVVVAREDLEIARGVRRALA